MKHHPKQKCRNDARISNRTNIQKKHRIFPQKTYRSLRGFAIFAGTDALECVAHIIYIFAFQERRLWQQKKRFLVMLQLRYSLLQ